MEEKLKEYLEYDQKTGHFKWLKNVYRRKNMVGTVAGGRSGPYVRITALGKEYLAHRLAWFFSYGKWPEMVDHINGDGYDNRLCNLRETNYMLNARNQAMHRTGRSLPFVHKHAGRWSGQFQYNGKTVRVGSFNTQEEASSAVYGYMKCAGLLKHFHLGED